MDRFEEMRNFVRVVDSGSITRAAETSHIAKSAISRRLSELEERLNVQLINRTTRRMTLTDAGRRFLSSGYDVIAKVDESLQTSEPVALTGTLDFAASYTVIGYFLPLHLDRLARLLPDVRLNLREMSRTALEDALLSGQIDIGVALTAIQGPDQEWQKTLEVGHFRWCSVSFGLWAVAFAVGCQSKGKNECQANSQ